MTRPLPPTLDEIRDHLRTSPPNLITYVRATCKTPQDCVLPVPHELTKATLLFPWTLADMTTVLRSGGAAYVNYVCVKTLKSLDSGFAPDIGRAAPLLVPISK